MTLYQNTQVRQNCKLLQEVYTAPTQDNEFVCKKYVDDQNSTNIIDQQTMKIKDIYMPNILYNKLIINDGEIPIAKINQTSLISMQTQITLIQTQLNNNTVSQSQLNSVITQVNSALDLVTNANNEIYNINILIANMQSRIESVENAINVTNQLIRNLHGI